jgi:hypothetical protein
VKTLTGSVDESGMPAAEQRLEVARRIERDGSPDAQAFTTAGSVARSAAWCAFERVESRSESALA